MAFLLIACCQSRLGIIRLLSPTTNFVRPAAATPYRQGRIVVHDNKCWLQCLRGACVRLHTEAARSDVGSLRQGRVHPNQRRLSGTEDSLTASQLPPAETVQEPHRRCRPAARVGMLEEASPNRRAAHTVGLLLRNTPPERMATQRQSSGESAADFRLTPSGQLGTQICHAQGILSTVVFSDDFWRCTPHETSAAGGRPSGSGEY